MRKGTKGYERVRIGTNGYERLYEWVVPGLVVRGWGSWLWLGLLARLLARLLFGVPDAI